MKVTTFITTPRLPSGALDSTVVLTAGHLAITSGCPTLSHTTLETSQPIPCLRRRPGRRRPSRRSRLHTHRPRDKIRPRHPLRQPRQRHPPRSRHMRRHPSSAGEDQPPPPPLLATLLTCPARPAPLRPRRNQSDSTDSKIGNRCSSPTPAAAGTTTSRCAWPCRVRTGSSLPSDPLEACRSLPVGAPYTGSGPTADAAADGLPSSADAPSLS